LSAFLAAKLLIEECGAIDSWASEMAGSKQGVLGAFGTWKVPVLFALSEGLTHFGIWLGDSSGYVNIVKLIRGIANAEEARVFQWHGMLRPVVPFLAVPFSYLVDYRDAIAVVNLGFFLLGTLFTYLLARELLGNDVAFISAVCFASAVPSLAFGTAVLTDGPGYAVQAILLYFVLHVLEEKRDTCTSVLAGVLIGIGILVKETTFIVLIFLVFRFFLRRGRLRIPQMMLIAIIGIGIPMGWAQLIGQSYLGFYGEGLAYRSPGYKGALVHPTLFALSAVYAFYLCLPFAFMAFFMINDDAFKTICEILVSAGVLLVLWPTSPESRFTFLTFPAVLPLAAYGMCQASQILCKRPWLKMISEKSWLTLLLMATVFYTNIVTFRLYFRTP